MLNWLHNKDKLEELRKTIDSQERFIKLLKEQNEKIEKEFDANNSKIEELIKGIEDIKLSSPMVTIKQFRGDDESYLATMASIGKSEEFKYYLTQLREQYIGLLLRGNEEASKYALGKIKCVDEIIKHLRVQEQLQEDAEDRRGK